MQLFGLDINIAGENIVQNNVFYERRFIVLFVVKNLDISKRNSKNCGKALRRLVLYFNENDLLRLGICRIERFIGVTSDGHDVRRIRHFVTYSLTHLADLSQFAARNYHTRFIDNTDHAVGGVFHLINNSLEQSVGHNLPLSKCERVLLHNKSIVQYHYILHYFL